MTHEPTSAKFPSDRNDEVQSVELGDLLGNDHQLHSTLDEIATEITNDSPGTSSYFLHDLLSWSMSLPHGLTAVAKRCATFVTVAAKRFFNAEAKLILAEAEAERIRVTAAADAERIRAEATKGRAEAKQIENAGQVQLQQGLAVADKITAETEEERAATKRRDDVMKLIKKSGMEWLAVRQGDVLQIVVTKDSDQKLIE